MNPPPQPSLFDPPPLPRKSRKHKQHRLCDASRLLFEDVKTRRNKAFLLILNLLTQYDFDTPDLCLTARQMLNILKEGGDVKPTAERNYLSPRLTELYDLGCVENPIDVEGEAFIKHVEGDSAAHNWRITDKGRELHACLTQLHKERRRAS
jgi:hypothetical protein